MVYFNYDFLKFLAENEVELASALASEHGVETVCPVDTHHADHRKEDAHTGTGASLKVERLEVLDGCPCITCLDKSQTVDGGGVGEHEREVEFHADTCVSVAFACVGGELSVFVTAQGYGLLCICV